MTSAPDTALGDLGALEIVTQRLAAALDSIEDHHGPLATPCDDWDLTALVDHVTGGNWFSCQILAGHSADDAMANTVNRFDDPHSVRDRATASLAEQGEAFNDDGALDRICHHVVGDLTGRQVLRLRLHDLIVHAWDIEQTLSRAEAGEAGKASALPEELIRWGLAELADEASLTAKHFQLDGGTPTGAGGEAAYLARFGRGV